MRKIPLIGTVLLKEGLIKPEQLKQALDRQAALKAQGKVVPVGELLIEQGAVNERQIRTALQIQTEIQVLAGEADKLGIRLMEANLITPSQLQVALADHRATGVRLGEALVARGYLAEPALDQFLRKQVHDRMRRQQRPPGQPGR